MQSFWNSFWTRIKVLQHFWCTKRFVFNGPRCRFFLFIFSTNWSKSMFYKICRCLLIWMNPGLMVSNLSGCHYAPLCHSHCLPKLKKILELCLSGFLSCLCLHQSIFTQPGWVRLTPEIRFDNFPKIISNHRFNHVFYSFHHNDESYWGCTKVTEF